MNLAFDATDLFKYTFFQSHSSPYSHLMLAENVFIAYCFIVYYNTLKYLPVFAFAVYTYIL